MNQIITYPNGLRLACQSIDTTRSVSLGVFVNTGSINETPENSGISHFIEHMLFKGTKNRSAYDIANEMESLGVNINAYTSREITAFYTISIDEHKYKCAEILSDIFFNATFTKENLDKERNVILEEISMSEDDPEDVCGELVAQAHYGNTNLSAPILGSIQNVKRFEREDILEYMSQYYVPPNVVISIAGNLTIEEGDQIVKKYFLDNFTSQVKAISKEVKLKMCHQFLTKIKPLEQGNMGIIFPSVPYKHKLQYATLLLSNILGGGMSSRLFQTIREERGLVYTIYCAINTHRENASLIIYFATAPENIKIAVEAIKIVLDEIKTNGLTTRELKKGKEILKSSMVLSSESSSSLMRRAALTTIIDNEIYDLDAKLALIDAITMEEVKETIDFIFDYKNVSASYVGKTIEKFDAIKIFDEA